MSQRKIYTIGETVYDVIIKSNLPVNARPGGSMLNSSISLGRLDLPVSFITEIGRDIIGEQIVNFLDENNVNTEFTYRYKQGKTALALAFLNEYNDAEYIFYKDYPVKRLGIEFPVVHKNDIVQFGSFFAISDNVRCPLKLFIDKAYEKGATIMYDPNYRESHLDDLPGAKKMIEENISLSTIVRGSADDFKLIYNAKNGKESFRIINNLGCGILIYTHGGNNVEFWSENLNLSIQVPFVNAISTIGAGDNFNAGLICQLYKHNFDRDNIYEKSSEQWRNTLNIAVRFGSHVCTSYDNYISESFAKSLK